MLNKLKEVIKKVMPEVDVENVTEESKLVDDLEFDSLAIMMLAVTLEEEFHVTFDGPITFITVGDVVKFLETHAK